jgi:hypothetical protein
MINLISRAMKKLRQRFCDHEFFLDDIQLRDIEGIVRCKCWKCGKLLQADYGLALKGHWVRWRKHHGDACAKIYESEKLK